MLKYYLTVAIRNLWRKKTYSIINMAGLSIGLAGCFLTLAYVLNEFSYDNYHSDANHTYRITTENQILGDYSAGCPYNLAPELENNLPEIIKTARVFNLDRTMIKKGDTFLNEDKVFLADQEVIDILDIQFLHGDLRAALDKPNAAVITSRIAAKYFGDENPVGKNLSLRWLGRLISLEVTGIIDEFPANSHVHMDILITQKILDIVYENVSRAEAVPFYESWGNRSFITYIKTIDRCDIERLERSIHNTWVSHLGEASSNVNVHLQPLRRIHLFSAHLTQDLAEHGNISSIILTTSVAILIALVAASNFIILSIADGTKSMKEFGIRKMVGAQRVQIINQVLFESLLLTLLTLPVSFGLVRVALPYFNQLMHLTLSTESFRNWEYILGVGCIATLVGLFCGGYIYIHLTKISPLDALRKKDNLQSSKSYLKNSLIVTQITIFIVLVTCTATIVSQLHFVMDDAVLGYEKENLISIKVNDRDFVAKYNQFKDEVQRNENIVNVTSFSGSSFPYRSGGYAQYQSNEDINATTNLYYLPSFGVGYDFIETLGIKLLMGERFRDHPGSKYDLVHLVNETAVQELHISEPIGRVYYEGDYQHRIIGVIEDFHFNSLFETVQPFVLYLTSEFISQVILRIKPENLTHTLAFLEKTWKDYSPDVFEYTFIDDDLENLYRSEVVLGKVVGYSAIFAILIATFGLFCLSRFMTLLRTKEIGIRKVVGASVPQVVGLLSKEFLVLVAIANVIAWPVAWYAMSRWLQNFAYRIDLGLGVFLLAGLLALVIALATVSWQTIRAATANPVEALRYE